MIKYFCDGCETEMFFNLEHHKPVEVHSDSTSTTYEYEQGFELIYYSTDFNRIELKSGAHYCHECSEKLCYWIPKPTDD